ncbi:uncharacterized protein METZ01_LOCUS321386 [marine metagenome]|uniref:Uncharacterized protein n=1 Tax=marine metagenome TaxID=408172 RepID=A0A382P9D4_9ZZZZ
MPAGTDHLCCQSGGRGPFGDACLAGDLPDGRTGYALLGSETNRRIDDFTSSVLSSTTHNHICK